MNFHIITIFPKIFDSYFAEGMVGRAIEGGIITTKAYDLRGWTTDNHKTVDDSPYGGGAGMVMKIEPLYKALKDIRPKTDGTKTRVVLFSAKGKKWTQALAKGYSRLDNVIMICGRYEGVDERITNFIDEEIAIGEYVLTGGELGAMVVVDSITRLLPGVLGNEGSFEDESHSTPGVLEYPQYTRPEVFEADGKKYEVPKILLSGNHAEIEKWRNEQRKKLK